MASSIPNKMTQTEKSNADQQTEVSSIKAAFPNRCRVISDVGEFSQVVTVQPENMDVTIKFQLPAAYPSVIPEITIRSQSLTEESIADVRQILRSKAREMLGQQMIRPLIVDAESHLRALGLKPGKTILANGHTFVDKHQNKRRKQKIKPKCEDELQNQKLPSMKTADDVVKRIIWDDALEKDDFIVGYFDRFRGLLEKCFSAFSWEDLASVDYDVLAVPKHRIQYFKYKKVKVWDKTRRIDNVFGSAEGTKTIDVVIKELQELERLGQTVEDSPFYNSENNDKSHLDSSDEDSSDDSDIEVTIGNIVGVTSTKSEKEQDSHQECRAAASVYGRYDKEEQRRKEIEFRNSLRPNHFLCVRITNVEIIDKIGKIQDELMDTESLFAECCIPGASLHLTLSTLGLDTTDQVLQCIEVLKKIEPDLKLALPTHNLKLHGVSNFHNQVMFSEVHHKIDFQNFHSLLKHALQEADIQIRDGYDYVPHVTIMKISRPIARILGTKHIKPELYSNHTQTYFGEQKVDSIYLCSMGKERREDGFYLTPFEMHFTT
uniref:RWD domain-containing protein n=1 Tax=Arion vulgaris TaxID=1028688 RepID=A0A0B6Y915_9EUPU